MVDSQLFVLFLFQPILLESTDAFYIFLGKNSRDNVLVWTGVNKLDRVHKYVWTRQEGWKRQMHGWLVGSNLSLGLANSVCHNWIWERKGKLICPFISCRVVSFPYVQLCRRII
jgi:hypothetical protein